MSTKLRSLPELKQSSNWLKLYLVNYPESIAHMTFTLILPMSNLKNEEKQ